MNWELIGKAALLLFVVALFVLWGVIMFKWWKSYRDWYKAAWVDLNMRKEEKRKNQEDFDRETEDVKHLIKGQRVTWTEYDEAMDFNKIDLNVHRLLIDPGMPRVDSEYEKEFTELSFDNPFITDVLDGEGEYLFRVAQDETYKNAVEKND